MKSPRWLQLCRQGTHACGRGVITLLCWISWTGLTVLAGIQVYVASTAELAVPQFALREIETRLQESGLTVQFGGASFDPTGRILLRNIDVSIAGIETPVLEAGVAELELNPIALAWRELDQRSVRLSAADLNLPAMISPTGEAEALVKGLDTTIVPGERPDEITIKHLTAGLRGIQISLRGSLDLSALPEGQGETPEFDVLLATLGRNYLRGCREVARVLPRLPEHEGAHLDLALQPSPEHLAKLDIILRLARLTAPPPTGHTDPIQVQNLTLNTHLMLLGGPRLVDVDLSSEQVNLPGEAALHHVRAKLGSLVDISTGRWEPRLMEMGAHEVRAAGLSLDAPVVRATLATLPVIPARIHGQLFDESIELNTDIDITTGAGRLRLRGHLGEEAVAEAGKRLDVDLSALLKWQQSPAIAVDLNLAPGGKPLRATAAFSTGPVEARYVPLTETKARLTWAGGTHVQVSEILLRTPSSTARGSYEFDTETLDFRFLLRGNLQPADIDGWFKDWWPRFWTSFEFPDTPPEARVEVSGRWTAPLETRVWVQAEGENAIIKGIALDSMRTHLFIRPGWADVIEFSASRPQGDVHGSFARQWRLPRGERWTAFEVKAEGRSDLSPLPKLLGDLGERIVAPLDVDGSIDLQIEGRVEREDLGAPVTSDFTINGQSSERWSFANFPFRGVSFEANYNNERLLIAPISAGWARGALNGRIELQGKDENRQVAFDLNLERAHLGESIRIVEAWSARRRGEDAAPESAYQKQIADGILELALTAQGPSDNLLGLQGTGNAAISNANLGELKLLGILSTMLGGSLLNFSTLKLDNAVGDFALRGDVLDFSTVKLTGTQGALDAKGQYFLEDKTLAFQAKVRPFEGSGALLDTVFTPLTNALEVKLLGQLSNPEWTFIYGPTNFLRTLAGENRRAEGNSASSPAEATANPVPTPELEPATPPANPTPDSENETETPPPSPPSP